MEDQQDESGLPDPTDVDWDAEFEQLPHAEIMADLVYQDSRRLVEEWCELRAGDAVGFDDMPPELGLESDTKIGTIFVDAYTEAICAVMEVDHDGLGQDQVDELTRAILGCLIQGVEIARGAVFDNAQAEEPR
jgi:hypothetical protein